MTHSVPLSQLARIIRTKCAGPFEWTLDVLFDDLSTLMWLKESGQLSAARLSEQYNVSPADIVGIHYFPPARAFKATFRRPFSAGTPGDTDIFCAQKHIPATQLTIQIPDVYSSTTPIVRRLSKASALRGVHQ